MTSVAGTPEVLIHAHAAVGESPVWDARTDRLCWVDLDAGTLVESDLVSGDDWTSSLGMTLGAIAPRRREEGFAVAVGDGFGFWAQERLTVTDPVLRKTPRRMNDAKCDAHGRLWAGSTHTALVPNAGILHRWDGRGPSMRMVDRLTLPNGLGWSPDGTIMYLIDSMTHQLLHARFHPDEGEVEEFTQLCTIAPGLPDGLCVDVEGFLWVAVWGGAQMRRYDPSGALVEVIVMPVSQPAGCMLDADGILFVTSATAGLSQAELAEQPDAGAVFAIATSTPGVPINPFAH